MCLQACIYISQALVSAYMYMHGTLLAVCSINLHVHASVPQAQAAPPPRRSLIEFEDGDPDELERMEQERIQRSMKNLYSHARTVRRCLQYATKVLDRYDVSV